MTLKFLKDHTHDLIVTINEAADGWSSREFHFKAGEEFEVDIITDTPTAVDVQFSNGNMAFLLPREIVTFIPNQ